MLPEQISWFLLIRAGEVLKWPCLHRRELLKESRNLISTLQVPRKMEQSIYGSLWQHTNDYVLQYVFIHSYGYLTGV